MATKAKTAKPTKKAEQKTKAQTETAEKVEKVTKTDKKDKSLPVSLPTVQELLEAGAHFGHEVRKWNPKMEQFIFTARNGIHVIDLEKTEKYLKKAVEFVYNQASAGKTFLFVATKRQAQDIVKTAAEKSGAKFMTTRWIGGLLTNFEVASKSIKNLTELKEKKEKGEFSHLTKKEQLLIDRRVAKLQANFGGVATLNRLPDVVFVLDARKEINTIREAARMNIPVIAIVDTNSDPTGIDYPIPANDDAIKSIDMVVNTVANAVVEGTKIAEKKQLAEVDEK